jgi:hypothetical protein
MQEARQAQSAQQFDRAEILLERVLMLMPDHAEARIELAWLMLRRGQWEAARGLLQSLAEDPRTPDQHRSSLMALLAQLPDRSSAQAPSVPPQPATSWRLELGLAASSNPLARSSADELTCTLPEGPLTLPLTTQPQLGAVASVSLSRVQENWGWELSSQRLSLPDARESYRMAWWARLPVDTAVPLHGVVTTQQGFDASRRSTLGVATQWRSSRWLWAWYNEPTLSDEGQFARVDLPLLRYRNYQLMASLERSVSHRKTQGYARAGMSADVTLAAGWRLQAHWSAQEDTQGYNPLLENGARRRLVTSQISLERQVKLNQENVIHWRLLASDRRSNLELFSFKEVAMQVAWSKVWR